MNIDWTHVTATIGAVCGLIVTVGTPILAVTTPLLEKYPGLTLTVTITGAVVTAAGMIAQSLNSASVNKLKGVRETLAASKK